MIDDPTYQEGWREEIINGERVTMPRLSFNHNQTAFNIALLFRNYLEGCQCTPISKGMDLYLSEENLFVPDFMIVSDPDMLRPDGVHGAPDLVVEVLSPGILRNDRGFKKEVYQKCGVREYWLVNPIDKSVEIYIAEDSAFALYDVFALRPDWELARMSEEERDAVVTHFKCSLFDDLDISLDDIFYRTF